MKKLDQEIAHRVGYTFRDPGLLEQALTHRSYSKRNNERLEFLGDAILGFLMAEILYQRFPGHSEGELTRLRASMVRRETLSAVARKLKIADWIRLGPGELKSGGFRRDSILADVIEALLGAVYLDGGMEGCRDRIHSWFMGRVEALPETGATKDPKSLLQEYLQSRNLVPPDYAMIRVEGQDHAQTFRVRCEVSALNVNTHGVGQSRKGAEQAAAREALREITGTAPERYDDA